MSDKTALRRPWPAGFSRVLAARLLMSGYFFVPYIVLYAESLRIRLGLLLVIEAIFALLTVAFDLPAGHLADRIGPRRALIIGTALEGSASLLLGGIPHALMFWAVQPLFAGSQALVMGADAALAAEVLRRAGREAEFEAAERVFQSSSLAANAVVLLSASLLSLLTLRAPFLATGMVQLIAALIFCTVPNVPATERQGAHRIPLLARMRGLADGVRRTPGLPVDLATMILTGTAFSVLLYLMPVIYVTSGVNVHLVGAVSALVALVAAGAASILPGEWPLRVSVMVAVVAAGVLATKIAVIVIIATVLLQAAQARLLPRYRARVLSDLKGHGEATAMSVVTTTRNIGFAVLAPAIGVFTDWSGPRGVSALCAGLFLIAGLAMSARMSLRPVPAGQPEEVN